MRKFKYLYKSFLNLVYENQIIERTNIPVKNSASSEELLILRDLLIHFKNLNPAMHYRKSINSKL